MDGLFEMTTSPELTQIIEIIETGGLPDDEQARHAIAQGTRLIGDGDLTKVVPWFEYAQRRAPSCTGLSFAIGLLRLAIGDPRATEPLELVVARTGWRDAIMQLAHARYQFGNADAAAAELHHTLTINAPGRDSAFSRFATTLADETGALGWCGLNNAGQIVLGGRVATIPPADLDILLDNIPARPQAIDRASPDSRVLSLPKGWSEGAQLQISARGRPLIGSPIQINQITRVEGFVEASNGGLTGWCWLPGEREITPIINLVAQRHPNQRLSRIAVDPHPTPRQFADFAAPRHFHFTAEDLATLDGPVTAATIHGRSLYGSPVNPREPIASAQRAAQTIATLYPMHGKARSGGDTDGMREPSIPVDSICVRQHHPPDTLPRPVDIVIPVYRGRAVTLACVASVLAARSLSDERIIIVIDASPDTGLVTELEQLAAHERVIVSVQSINRGFPATANIGLRLTAGRDVVLLNSDTLVPDHWLSRLQQSVYSADDIGTATPLSNDATIMSYPVPNAANPPPSLDLVQRRSALAARINGIATVDVPTGHGFCLYIRQECLAETGVLREDVFGHGYGEENDFCMRARALGWRHVAVPGVYVGHIGSQSFSSTRTHLIRRNLNILNRLHIGYDHLIQQFLAADPLAVFRRRLDTARFCADLGDRRTVALISHNRSGGVKRHVDDRARRHQEAGDCAVILRPDRSPTGHMLCAIDVLGDDETFPNLKFDLSTEYQCFREWLQSIRVKYIEFHHFIGHADAIHDIVRSINVPYDVFIHDYAWFCPRITLTSGDHRYCGEPRVEECTTCISDHGATLDERISPVALRQRSKAVLQSARSVIAPSFDTARRIESQLGRDTLVGAWEPDADLSLKTITAARGDRRKICVTGAIGYEKGYDTLLRIARFVAKRDLPLDLAIVGFTCDDRRLLETGRVSITGRYDETEVVELIREQQADLGFLPALWPETWSYTLSQMWAAALPVIAYDIGAPAERIRSTGGGLVIPLHTPIEHLVALFFYPTLLPAASERYSHHPSTRSPTVRLHTPAHLPHARNATTRPLAQPA
ncbi:glycosyltransferase [Acidiphilium sp.]|uniref:glycosyltransferase n=1 Tax=Acidiphilium sp. TaxID=527 RepID=UPI003D069933